jgi:hypothetical protein
MAESVQRPDEMENNIFDLFVSSWRCNDIHTFIRTHIPWIKIYQNDSRLWNKSNVWDIWCVQNIQNYYSAKYCKYFMYSIMDRKINVKSDSSVYLSIFIIVPFHS